MLRLRAFVSTCRVASKPHGWHATSCFNSGHQILSYVLSQLAEHPHVKAFTELPQEHAAPVFRITFTAADHSIALRQLTPTEVAEMQARKTSKEERAGFLPLKWVQALYARRSRWGDQTRVSLSVTRLTAPDTGIRSQS